MWPRGLFGGRRFGWVCFCLLALGTGGVADAQDLASAIKATYLVKFTGFVDWPPSAFTAPDSPFVLCVIGGQPVGSLVKEAAAGASVGPHPIEIRTPPFVTRTSGCNMLFAAGPGTDGALANSRGVPVLTVTDAPAGTSPRGIINFLVRDNRVRFEIDPQAAAANGLHISSKLMALAVNVR
jgi:hypothetical protein